MSLKSIKNTLSPECRFHARHLLTGLFRHFMWKPTAAHSPLPQSKWKEKAFLSVADCFSLIKIWLKPFIINPSANEIACICQNVGIYPLQISPPYLNRCVSKHHTVTRQTAYAINETATKCHIIIILNEKTMRTKWTKQPLCEWHKTQCITPTPAEQHYQRTVRGLCTMATH